MGFAGSFATGPESAFSIALPFATLEGSFSRIIALAFDGFRAFGAFLITAALGSFGLRIARISRISFFDYVLACTSCSYYRSSSCNITFPSIKKLHEKFSLHSFCFRVLRNSI